MLINLFDVPRASDKPLRLAMRTDGVLSSAFGLAGLTGQVSEFSGAPQGFQHAMDVFFITYGVVVLGLAALPSVRGAGLSAVAANMLYTSAVLLLLPSGFPLTRDGVRFTLASAAYTTMIGGLQYLAWRRVKWHARRAASVGL